ncbi:DUF4389 domain-containing protein [Amycolatopsis sp. NPDC059657]|uniref:DUF4389 domain-containing protein n=1 Tax=Amycolatopsis sp. NPDC059657 TaxID=3346899 RepID=UPI00366F1768
MNESSPVRIEGNLDEPVSRWLWLVKWLLAIPHYFILAFLWIAYVLVTVVAFFAILFTGRYPRALFEFTVGVLRWSWRVQFYSYGALGTDRYPPFTLADVPDYPARLDIAYPERLSRGLVLVKWWLLAIPHYLVTGLFVGGGTLLVWQSGNRDFQWAGGGLVGILVLVAGVVLLVTGSYPKPIFDFVLGMDRWVYRVAAYASLMTDEYPPFRLDMGGGDRTIPVTPAETTPPPQAGWTTGRTVSVVFGAVLALISVGLLTGGGALLWADRTQRDADGYFHASDSFYTAGYALTTGPLHVEGVRASGAGLTSAVGDVRFRVVSQDPLKPVFLGIAPSNAVNRYLAGAQYTVVNDFTRHGADRTEYPGGAVPGNPETAGIWAVKTSGSGWQTLTWPIADGDWTVVVLNADGSPGVSAQVEAGATLPVLGWIAGGLLIGGLIVLAGGVALIWGAAHRAAQPKEESHVEA